MAAGSSAPAGSLIAPDGLETASQPQGDGTLGTLSAPDAFYDDAAPQLVQNRDQLPPLHACAFKGKPELQGLHLPCMHGEVRTQRRSMGTLCAFHAPSAGAGDLSGVLACITNGESVNEVIMMPNQRNSIVCGVSALGPAHTGRMDACALCVHVANVGAQQLCHCLRACTACRVWGVRHHGIRICRGIGRVAHTMRCHGPWLRSLDQTKARTQPLWRTIIHVCLWHCAIWRAMQAAARMHMPRRCAHPQLDSGFRNSKPLQDVHTCMPGFTLPVPVTPAISQCVQRTLVQVHA